MCNCLGIILHAALHTIELSPCLFYQVHSALWSIFFLGEHPLVIGISYSLCRVILSLCFSDSLVLRLLACLLLNKAASAYGHRIRLVKGFLRPVDIVGYNLPCVLSELGVIQFRYLFCRELRKVRIAILKHRHFSSVLKRDFRSIIFLVRYVLRLVQCGDFCFVTRLSLIGCGIIGRDIIGYDIIGRHNIVGWFGLVYKRWLRCVLCLLESLLSLLPVFVHRHCTERPH